MRYLIFVVLLGISKLSFSQKLEDVLPIAKTYLDSSKQVRAQLTSILNGKPKYFKKGKPLIYTCKRVEFINLSELSHILLDSCDLWGMNKKELKDYDMYKKVYQFDSFVLEKLSDFNKRDTKYPFYARYSKPSGLILPLIILRNETGDISNPCENQNFPTMGSGLAVLLVFDKEFKRVTNCLFSEIAFN